MNHCKERIFVGLIIAVILPPIMLISKTCSAQGYGNFGFSALAGVPKKDHALVGVCPPPTTRITAFVVVLFTSVIVRNNKNAPLHILEQSLFYSVTLNELLQF